MERSHVYMVKKGKENMKSIKNIIKKIPGVLSLHRWAMHQLSIYWPAQATRILYHRQMGRPLNLRNPQAFTEKIQWLKLNKYWRNPQVAQCADKFAVRKYIEEKDCAELLTKLYGAWDSVSDINWDVLPEQFVFKCNHGSGYNIVITDKKATDKQVIMKQLDQWMHERYGVGSVEQGIYDNIKRKIIAEEFIQTADGQPPKDFKFFCADGKVKLLFVASDRKDGQTKFDYYYPNWEHIAVRNIFPNAGVISKPVDLDKMIIYAEKLSKGIPLVRVDFYNEAGRIYFGELTFTHFGGLNGFEPDSYDFTFGKLLPDVQVWKMMK